MKQVPTILLLSLLLLSAIANAGWFDKQGKSIPDSGNMKSVGNLNAQLVITDNEEQVLNNWNTPSESVYFPTTETIERNKIITGFVVFGGCAVDEKGNCDLKMHITVYQPDGKIYLKFPAMEVWSGKPAPPHGIIGLSSQYMRVRIEPGEQLGKYRVDARIVDNINNNSMVLTSYFTAVESRE